MADKLVLGQAVDTAWTVYRATHDDVHELDERRRLLERYLEERWKGRENDTEAVDVRRPGLSPAIGNLVTGMSHLKLLIGRIAATTARPNWTLNAISWLVAAVFVEAFRSAFGG